MHLNIFAQMENESRFRQVTCRLVYHMQVYLLHWPGQHCIFHQSYTWNPIWEETLEMEFS